MLRTTAQAEAIPTDEADLHRQADLVAALGAALVQRVGTSLLEAPEAPPEEPEQLLETLRPIWPDLI